MNDESNFSPRLHLLMVYFRLSEGSVSFSAFKGHETLMISVEKRGLCCIKLKTTQENINNSKRAIIMIINATWFSYCAVNGDYTWAHSSDNSTRRFLTTSRLVLFLRRTVLQLSVMNTEEQFSPHYLRNLHVMVRGLSSVITGLPLPLVADALDEVLVEVADVEVPHLQIISGVFKRRSLSCKKKSMNYSSSTADKAGYFLKINTALNMTWHLVPIPYFSP